MEEHLFMGIYAGCMMIIAKEDEQSKVGMFSLVAAEVYCFH